MLVYALRGNALFSTICGFVLLTAASRISDVLGAGDPWLLRFIGGVLILFALDLFTSSKSSPVSSSKARYFIWMDLAWVIGSAVLLLVAGPAFSTAGKLLIAAVSTIVAVFATVQHVGLRRELQMKFSRSDGAQ